MGNRDWLPTREADLRGVFVKWLEWLRDADKQLAFGWNAAACARVADAIDAFFAAQNAYRLNDSSSNRIMKNVTKKIALVLVRAFASSDIRFNTRMTEMDKRHLSVHVGDGHRSRHPAPSDHVDFKLSVDAESHAVRADYRIDGESGHSKGRYRGVEIRYWTLPLDAPVPITADIPAWRSTTNTATPWMHTFDAHEVGLRLSLVMRWENSALGKSETSGRGPWSAVVSVVIA
jgi:hypothetical protein